MQKTVTVPTTRITKQRTLIRIYDLNDIPLSVTRRFAKDRKRHVKNKRAVRAVKLLSEQNGNCRTRAKQENWRVCGEAPFEHTERSLSSFTRRPLSGWTAAGPII